VTTGALSSAYHMTGYRSYAPLLPLVPGWLKRRDFGSVDAVIVSHHAFAVAAVNSCDGGNGDATAHTPTIVYVHSPARWAWDEAMRREEASSLPGKLALDVLSKLAIRTELAAAPKITTVVANSTAVAQRIKHHWNRESHVVHPPVDIDFYTPDTTEAREDYFLLAGVKLVVAGAGRDAAKCQKLAEGADITFVGRVSNDEFRSLYRRARAMVMPGEEDFGITPVEAMACGTPVLALGVGGALDSVVDGLTGTFVTGVDDAEVVGNFAEQFASFDGSVYDPADIRLHAEQFSRKAFRTNMAGVVAQTVATFRDA
jgi:glycosyltransferase involved in cell wall biosynthesis